MDKVKLPRRYTTGSRFGSFSSSDCERGQMMPSLSKSHKGSEESSIRSSDSSDSSVVFHSCSEGLDTTDGASERASLHSDAKEDLRMGEPSTKFGPKKAGIPECSTNPISPSEIEEVTNGGNASATNEAEEVALLKPEAKQGIDDGTKTCDNASAALQIEEDSKTGTCMQPKCNRPTIRQILPCILIAACVGALGLAATNEIPGFDLNRRVTISGLVGIILAVIDLFFIIKLKKQKGIFTLPAALLTYFFNEDVTDCLEGILNWVV